MPENGLWLQCSCGASYRALKYYISENRWYQTGGDLTAFLEKHSGYHPEHTVTPVTEDAQPAEFDAGSASRSREVFGRELLRELADHPGCASVVRKALTCIALGERQP